MKIVQATVMCRGTSVTLVAPHDEIGSQVGRVVAEWVQAMAGETQTGSASYSDEIKVVSVSAFEVSP